MPAQNEPVKWEKKEKALCVSCTSTQHKRWNKLFGGKSEVSRRVRELLDAEADRLEKA